MALGLVLAAPWCAAVGFVVLGRGARAAEGRAVALIGALLLMMAGTLLRAKHDDLVAGKRIDLNAARLDAPALADATGISADLAQRVLDARNARPGHAFRSLGQIPFLGSAPRPAVRQLEAWAASKRWDALQRVVRTGSIEPSPVRPPVPQTEASLDPALDLEARAAALLPHPPFRLDRSSRGVLAAALGDTGIVDRVVQYRITQPSPPVSLSEIPAVPLDTVVLREPAQAEGLFVWVTALLLALFLGGHLYLRWRMPGADALLWPVFGGLAVFGVLMLFAVVPPLTARGTAVPFLGSVPEYAGQGVAVALAMLLLPASRSMLRMSERIGRPWIAGFLGAAILIPNVLAQFGWKGLAILLGAVAAGAWLVYRPLPDLESAAKTIRSRGAAPKTEPNDPPRPAWDIGPAARGLAALFALGLVALTFARLAGGKTGYAPLVELSKILLVLFTARICSDYELFLGQGLGDLPARPRWELFGCWVAAMLLAFMSNDLGFLLLLWIPFTLLLSLSIGRAWPVGIGVAGWLGGSVLLVVSGHTRFPERYSGWLNPWTASSTQMAEAFQRMASVPSVVAGAGLGRGTRLAVSTDTRDVVLPLYYEHLGWIGIALVLGLLLLGIHRLFRVGLRARDSFAHWAVLGIACIFSVQTVYMVGADFGAWPLTGMTLAPLASGKAAVFFTLVAAFLAIAASADPVGRSGPERRKRARFASGAFGLFAGLILYAGARLAKTAVVDRDAIAYRAIHGAPNPRAATELRGLRTGRILARRIGRAGYGPANLTPLAYSERDADGAEVRRYPFGAAAFAVAGVRTSARAAGGESAWRDRLTGLDAFVDRAAPATPPSTQQSALLVDLWRRQNHPLWPRDEKIEPQDLETTLVTEMDAPAYDALRAHLAASRARSGVRPRKGAMLVVDLRTGEVLAYAQFPSPQPDAIEAVWDGWDRLATDPFGYLDPNGQLIDLVRHTDRAPGSTAKINTMMALSEAGAAGRTFVCRPGVIVHGQAINDFHNENHGTVGLRQILKYSCNRGAAQAGAVVGPDRLLAQYERLRYPLPNMTSRGSTFRRYYQQIAFGQVMSASLWDLLTSVCAVARGGEAIELHLDRRDPASIERWRVCSRETAARVADGMRAVDEPGGTAWSVYHGLHDWPSKTGSAQVAGAPETDAWFVGYAPREKPALAFAVWAEEDGTGGGLAKSINLPGLIERDLRSMGIVEPTARPRGRRRRQEPAPQPGAVEQLLESPELAKPRELLNGIRQRFDRARQGLGAVERELGRLRGH